MKILARILLGSLCLFLVALSAHAQGAGRPGSYKANADQRFVRQLVKLEDERPDLRRLSRVYYGAASTLTSGTSSLEVLGSELLRRETERERLTAILSGPLERLKNSNIQFQEESSNLLDDPESRLVLYRTSLAGLESCWRLDAYLRLLETYGATSRELLGSIAVREACTTVRTASFAPSVRAILREALVEQIFQRAELEELREEFASLEELLDELLQAEEP